ncbi:dual specificity protein phosphatase Mpk3 isoform X1 [Bombyx mandarina]|nr:dual specificity protein phosphatase Mpk3 isoform X1 [Bombyx mandarina]
MGLRSLRISGSGCEETLSSGSSSECEEVHSHVQQDFPIEILPNLYLGNSTNSEDCEALARHNIKYVLNVTPDLPNTFEAEGCGINYLKIPIADHWSQNLAVHFPQAIRFIEEAMSARCGVLVHCVAGVSRSVTVTLAYLMQRHRLSLRDAFELVRSRKTDIAPNFHFMRQLHSFERDLGLHEHSASLSAARDGGRRARARGGGRRALRRVARLRHRVRPLERAPGHPAMTVLLSAASALALSACPPRPPSQPRPIRSALVE